MKNKQNFLFLIVFLLGALNLNRVDFSLNKVFATDCDVLTGEEKEKCEDEMEAIEDDIKSLEKKLNKTEAEKARLEQNLNKVKGAVYTTAQAISKTEKQIQETEKNIKNKEKYLKALEESMERKKEALRIMMQNSYYDADQPLLFGFLDRWSFLETVTDLDNNLRVKEEVIVLMDEIKKDKESVENETVELSLTIGEKEELLDIKESQKKALEREAYGIAEAVEEKMDSIESLRSKLSETKNDLNKLLGKTYDTDDIKDAIKFASKQTGVRKGFLFGMLSIESRLGASVGGCTYKESRMSGTRAEIFKDICDELDYNYKKQKVSCPPASYKGTGGAMGAAQFMPDTWRGYEKKIANATGHNPPDPWNLVDGVMAMALKLENDGATKSGKTTITSPCDGKKISIKWEEYASLKYLGWSCYGLTNYAKRVQALSGNYDQL
ncbi:MAG: lytic murein transglycosylase [Candidatus Moranbacteria bacterium]|jgi:peptidoglycan hydrolase CwlO-like protein|nr:lytic murein transglycosylase [Candidatus Moranbacteria bacterium]